MSTLLFALALAMQQVPDLVLDGAVPAEVAYFEIPLEVPAGTVEFQIAHHSTDDADVLDWGLLEPGGGFRGYGGGNLEDTVIGVAASSRSYVPGTIPAGTWALYVGKARVSSASPGYHVEVTFRTTATLPPATDRSPYAEAAPLETRARFFAGDFHVHSEDSGDARPPLEEIASFAESRGLDFVVLTEHNTIAQVDRLGAVQARHPALLLVPGLELTTYEGHAGCFGATRWVDHRLGYGDATLASALEALAAQEALVFINHPSIELGDLCIGCAWRLGIPPLGSIHGVEIASGGWAQAGRYFALDAMALWESMLDAGHHLAAIGGSDDHQAGQGVQSPIGDPTTLVFAQGLGAAALREGILASRTVVKMQGPGDPMITLETDPARSGDTVFANETRVHATVTGGVGARFRFVQNGRGVAQSLEITGDPQTFTLVRSVPAKGDLAMRVRAEVLIEDQGELVPRTLTSYVWLEPAPPADGCSCASARARTTVDAGWLAAIAALWLSRRIRRR
ncbi:MAG: CehA/McbA family metallohydrolase [Pseudomonadota bacterium]